MLWYVKSHMYTILDSDRLKSTILHLFNNCIRLIWMMEDCLWDFKELNCTDVNINASSLESFLLLIYYHLSTSQNISMWLAVLKNNLNVLYLLRDRTWDQNILSLSLKIKSLMKCNRLYVNLYYSHTQYKNNEDKIQSSDFNRLSHSKKEYLQNCRPV